MPRPLFPLVVATLYLAAPSLADDAPSPAVKRILDEAASEVNKNRQAFDAANKKPLAAAREKLQELAKKLVDDGKPEEAALVLKQVGTLEADVLGKSSAPRTTGPNRTAPEKPLLQRLEGKWKHHASNNHYRLESSGIASVCRNSDGGVVNRGAIRLTSPGVALIAWDTGDKDELHMAGADIVALLGANPDGRRTTLVLERMK